jgi:hypothetical protein
LSNCTQTRFTRSILFLKFWATARRSHGQCHEQLIDDDDVG